ncbi:hypothetical protein JCM10450v2_002312 [Rhodotorula kratochvilovae]
MAARPVPSVLVHRPLLPPSSAPRPPPPPSAPSPAEDGLIRCSQCKNRKPPSEYPARLINLQPYQVCTAHGWYWTPAKQLSQWAPATRSSLDKVCDEAVRVQSGQAKWLVEGGAGDRPVLVERIAAAGNWTAEENQTRPSTAKGDAAPSPTWVYTLWPSSTSTTPAPEPQQLHKLQLWHHEAAGVYTILLKADGAAKKPAPWARPGRVRPSQAKKREEGAQAALLSGGGAAPLRAAAGPPAPDSGDIVVAPPPAPPKKRRARFAPSAPSAARDRDRDRQQMPPPPVPAARPAKKARRVEPQLVSPMPTSSASAPLQTPFSAAAGSEWSHFLSFPTLLTPQPAPPHPNFPQQQQPSHDFPLDPLLFPSFPTTPAPAAAVQASDPPPLSLAELLSSAIFEPPIIDLPPRAPYAHAHAPSRAGRELDAAVADALGATPDAHSSGEEEDEEDEEGEDEGREGYYEDSIPDESSAEEEDDDDGEGDGAGSVSSFFESSAEETEYGTGDEGAEGESDEGEDNWLEGFAAQQMGLRRGGEEEDEEEEEEELDEEEDDELSEGEPSGPAKPARARGAGGRRGEADDEVDELESPTSGSEGR